MQNMRDDYEVLYTHAEYNQFLNLRAGLVSNVLITVTEGVCPDLFIVAVFQ